MFARIFAHQETREKHVKEKRKKGFEPSTFALATQHSTIELFPLFVFEFVMCLHLLIVKTLTIQKQKHKGNSCAQQEGIIASLEQKNSIKKTKLCFEWVVNNVSHRRV